LGGVLSANFSAASRRASVSSGVYVSGELSAMKPAYHISLTASEKRMIADLVIIETQIQWIMRMTMQALLGLSSTAAQAILGSTNIGPNMATWLAVVMEKHPSEDAKSWAIYANSEAATLANDRNSFAHSIWGFHTNVSGEDQISLLFGNTKHPMTKYRVRSGLRIKNAAKVELARLKHAREAAFRLSCIFAHIHWVGNPAYDGPSPWQRKLGKPPPRPRSMEELRKAKAQSRQPKPSRE